MRNKYTTRNEAVEREIVAPLNESIGVTAEDFDIEAIANEVVTTVGEGTRLRFLVPDVEEFWKACAAHVI